MTIESIIEFALFAAVAYAVVRFAISKMKADKDPAYKAGKDFIDRL